MLEHDEWFTEYHAGTEKVRRGIAASAKEAADQVSTGGSFRVTMQPGDATSYELFGVVEGLEEGRPRVWLAWTFHGAHPFWLDGPVPVHPRYAAEKLDLDNAHSANVVADFISCLAVAVLGEQGVLT